MVKMFERSKHTRRTRLVSLTMVGLVTAGCLAHVAPSQQMRTLAFVTNAGDNTVSVIDLNGPVVTNTLSTGAMPRGVAVSPDGLVYVTSQLSDIVTVIRMAENKAIAAIPVAKGPYGVAVSPDGKEVYVTHAGHFPLYGTTVSVIDARTRKVVGTIPVGNQPIGIAVSPDGRWLYVADQWGTDTGTARTSGLSVIEVATRTSRTIDLDEGMATGIAISPDGAYAYVAHETPIGIIRVVRTSDLTTVAKVQVGNGPFGVAVSPDGKMVYAANLGTAEGDETVSVIRTQDWTAVKTITVGKAPVGIAVTPDGREVVVANRRSNTVSFIDVVTHQVIATLPVGNEPWALGTFIGIVPAR